MTFYRWAVLSMLCTATVFALPPGGPGGPPNNSRVKTNVQSRVSIRIDGNRRIIESNGIPDHETGMFPGPGNPNAIMVQNYHFEIAIHPTKAPHPISIRGWLFGVAVDGVVFDPGTADFWHNDRDSIWNVEGIIDGRRTLGIDWSDAHVQPNGAYHYHGIPWGILDEYHAEKKMFLVGWAADGFPIYGPYAYKDPNSASSPVVEMRSSYQLKSGTRPGGNQGPGGRYDGTYTGDYEYRPGAGDLDECNGRTGVTPEFPQGTYYYVLTTAFPLVPRYFRGTPDPSFRHPFDPARGRGRGPGPRGPGGRRPPPPPFRNQE
jgi:hypothetical protein